MKIIDAFMFSEAYEADLLYIKFNLENEAISEWVITEIEYTHQGEYKGFFAKKLLENDKRFTPFLNKIKLIEGNLRPNFEKKSNAGHFEDKTLPFEWLQRNLAVDYILSNHDSDTYVFLSDTDEMLDLTDPKKRSFLYKKLRGKDLLRVPRNRFWYDFDNLWLKVNYSPIVTVDYIRKRNDYLGKIRLENYGHGYNWSKKICFEYSYCFNAEYIKRKYSSFIHTGYLEEEIDKGIKCNHRPVSSIRNEKITLHPMWWMRNVKLNQRNSPQFVRDNIAALKTNTVPVNYKTNRAINYPQYFSERFPGHIFYDIKRMFYLWAYNAAPAISRLLRIGRFSKQTKNNANT